MDVSSDVAAVDSDDDDEPLFDVSKVVMVVQERTISPKEVKRPTKYIKICFVPLCPNTSKSTPEKMFITIPVNPARRKQWLEAVGKTSVGRNPKSPMFCCEDHFNLPKDMKNYDEHLKKGKVQLILFQTVVPSVFICNNYGHLSRLERIEVLRKLHEERNLVLRAQENDELEVTPTSRLKMTSRQKILQAAKQKRSEQVTPNKTVFIEVPAFEYEDPTEYTEIKENGIDTIIIDDSD